MGHDVGVVCLCAMCDSYFLVIVSQVALSAAAPRRVACLDAAPAVRARQFE